MLHLRSLVFVGVAAVLSACSNGNSLKLVPDGTEVGALSEVFVATNRAQISGPEQYVRNDSTEYLKLVARIPPNRSAGELTLPGREINADEHFLAQSISKHPTAEHHIRDLRKSLMRRPANAREVVLFVHGYYTNFAYGVMRVAQLDHDLKYPGAVTHFSWPSAGRPLGYGYDRDSVLFSRDALESYIRDLAKTGVRVLLVGHSMGAQLSVEAIRQIELKTPGWSKRNLSGVVLLSPDIDIDVFRSQTSAIAQMPEPFIIFVSDKDRVLDLSAFITGERERLGNLSDASRLSEIQVTLMDVTNFNNGLGHFNVGTSEGLMSILRELPQLDSTFAGNVTGGETFRYGAVMTIQNVTSIILSPISALP